jgi:hypothetical protein
MQQINTEICECQYDGKVKRRLAIDRNKREKMSDNYARLLDNINLV